VKRLISFLLLCALCLPLCACGTQSTVSSEITAFIEEGEHFSVEVAAVSVQPGGDAAFYIQTEEGYNVTAADYSGEYELYETRGLTKLILKDLRYPTRIKLSLSFNTRIITYNANGGESVTGEGTEVSRSYDISYHIRPNTSIGTDIFERDGYTLVGWNTEPDGSGTAVGLGSRVTVDSRLTLYAQWSKWTEEEYFSYQIRGNAAEISACSYRGEVLTVPEKLGEYNVTVILGGAFTHCPSQTVILPKSIRTVREGAFLSSELSTLYFYDNMDYITDDSFINCKNLSTLHINAIEDPYGFSTRRESLWIDKLDLLMTTMGEKRLIFYGGCSMWYNLIGTEAQELSGDYRVLNMGRNGLVSSLFQLDVLQNFMTEEDILICTPEISSRQQLIQTTAFGSNDKKLWCAIEYNYDILAMVDIRMFSNGVLEYFRQYLNNKQPGGSYTDIYHDSKGREYLDSTLSIPYERTVSAETLADTDKAIIYLSYLDDLSRLEEAYSKFTEKGIRIYVSCAVLDIDEVPEEQLTDLDEMARRYTEKFSAMEGVTVISSLYDFLYRNPDFFDSVYHMLSEPARECTQKWMRDVLAQMEKDGLITQ